MMPAPEQPAAPPTRLETYREALHRLLAANGVPVGALDAVLVLAETLEGKPTFRARLLSFLEGLVRREPEPVSSLELLSLLTSTAQGRAVDLADPTLQAPLGELLAFLGQGEADRTWGSQVYETPPGRRPRRHLSAEELQTGAGSLNRSRAEEWQSAKSSLAPSSPRGRSYAAIALFSLVLGLAVGLVSRGHSPLRAVPAAERAGRQPMLDEDTGPRRQDGERTADLADVPIGIEPTLATSDLDRVRLRGLSGRQPEPTLRRRGERSSAIRGSEGAGIAPRHSGAAARRASAAGDSTTTAVAGRASGTRSAGSAIATHGAGTQPANLKAASSEAAALQPPSSRSPGRITDRDAIARVLLHGTEGDGFHAPVHAFNSLQPSVVAGSAGIMAANVLSSPVPAYPAGASASQVQGQVVIQAVVGKDGHITETRVVSGPPLLQKAALDAVGRWSYRPYVVDGKPAEVATTAIVDFRLGR